MSNAILDISTEENTLKTFRLIFFSILASSVASVLPISFKVSNFGYLFCISAILFAATVETFIKLEDGQFKSTLYQRIAFIIDIMIIVPFFIIISYSLEDYCNYIINLGNQTACSTEFISELIYAPSKLRIISITIAILFLILLIRGLLDRIFKKKDSIKTKAWGWIVAHIVAIIIATYVSTLINLIQLDYDHLFASIQISGDIHLHFLNNCKDYLQSEIFKPISAIASKINTLTYISASVVLLYIFFYYIAPFDIKFRENESKK